MKDKLQTWHVIVATVLIVTIGTVVIVDQWARYCIRNRGFGLSSLKGVDVSLSFIGIRIENSRPMIFYSAVINGPLGMVEAIGGYDIYSFGTSNTGLMGG